MAEGSNIKSKKYFMDNMQKSYIVVKALIKNKSSFLILKTKDSDQNNKLSGWESPGGHLINNEEIITGLKREIREETGLNVNILFPFNVYSANIGQENSAIGINYLAEYTNGEIKMDINEHSEYQWTTISIIRKLKDSIGLQKEIDAYENFIKKYEHFKKKFNIIQICPKKK